MSCRELFRLPVYVNPVRTPTWTLPIKLYLGIQAHNKFGLPNLYMGVNLYSKP
jgi:hypothetical protein